MLAKCTLLATLSLLSLTTLCAQASAGTVSVCNKTAEPFNIAIAYKDPQKGWVSRGWWRVQPKNCTVPLYRGQESVFYVYGSANHRVPVFNESTQPGGTFCLSHERFNETRRVVNGKLACGQDDFIQRTFRKIEGATGNHHTLYVTGEAQTRTDTPPQVTPSPEPEKKTEAPPRQTEPKLAQPAPPTRACQLYPALCS